LAFKVNVGSQIPGRFVASLTACGEKHLAILHDLSSMTGYVVRERHRIEAVPVDVTSQLVRER
jgi:hypothetical protein